MGVGTYSIMVQLRTDPLKNLFIYLSIFGCAGSSLLGVDFLQLWQVGPALQLRLMGFSLQWLLLLLSMDSKVQASVVAACWP